ncbi:MULTISPECIES: polysaccharide deacetylase family protein [Rhodomicrobium]|uniref:polysaccharide deacetylase family protein n=1 Tax=Rhodomicrobium TaxID=1068 RepID=UPI000B4AC5BE|nr:MULTISPECIES: polysaccharide deacetylase family protein [Rhodomicrobium]
MFGLVKAISAAAIFFGGVAAAHAGDCADDPKTTGLSRTVAVDSTGGKLIGRLQYANTTLLRRMEVVLTFDDGPHPQHTKQILDTLDRHCVKATFFTVGRMALFMQAALKDAANRGNTIATHTWSHPRDLSKMPFEDAKVEIEKGFVATSYALGQPIAPFFRYPGLNDSPELNAYLASRNIAVMSVDVVTDDTMAGTTPEQLINRAMERVRRMHGGIVLFHDLKAVTADALDGFLIQLKLEGYKVVHIVSNSGYQPDRALVARADFSKSSLQSKVFTGVGAEGRANQDGKVLAAGHVDVMKTEFIDLESSAMSAKQGAASLKQDEAAALKQERAPAW